MIAFIRAHALAVAAGAVVVLAGLAWLAFGYFAVHTLFIDEEVSEAVPTFDAAAQPATDPSAEAPAATSDPAAPASPDATVAPDAEPSGEPDPEATDTAGPETDEGTTQPDAAPSGEPEAPAAAEIVTEYAGDFESGAHSTSGRAIVLGNGTGQRFLRFEDFETDNGPDLNVYLVNSSTGDVSDYVDLGDLKGNIGEQNYEIPEGVDLDLYDEVVIWCVRFGVGFGDALLMAA